LNCGSSNERTNLQGWLGELPSQIPTSFCARLLGPALTLDTFEQQMNDQHDAAKIQSNHQLFIELWMAE
jgi:hypothetical protein